MIVVEVSIGNGGVRVRDGYDSIRGLRILGLDELSSVAGICFVGSGMAWLTYNYEFYQ